MNTSGSDGIEYADTPAAPEQAGKEMCQDCWHPRSFHAQGNCIHEAYGEEKNSMRWLQCHCEAFVSKDGAEQAEERDAPEGCTGPFSSAHDCPVHRPAVGVEQPEPVAIKEILGRAFHAGISWEEDGRVHHPDNPTAAFNAWYTNTDPAMAFTHPPEPDTRLREALGAILAIIEAPAGIPAYIIKPIENIARTALEEKTG